MQSLAVRKPQLTIQHLYVDGRWDDGEFITRIEDAEYRAYLATVKSINICQELAMIAEENHEKLASNIHSWFIYLAFAVWYFKKDSLLQTLSKVISKAASPELHNFYGETRLLQIYLSINKKTALKTPLVSPMLHSVTIEQLCCNYIISNSLGLQQAQRKA